MPESGLWFWIPKAMLMDLFTELPQGVFAKQNLFSKGGLGQLMLELKGGHVFVIKESGVQWVAWDTVWERLGISFLEVKAKAPF